MSIIDLVKISFRNLIRQKLRTFLTMVSVMIGTSSIVLMMSLGFAIEKENKNFLKEMGSLTNIDVLNPNSMNDNEFFFIEDDISGVDKEKKSGKKAEELDDKLIVKLKKIKHVEAVMPKIKIDNYSIISGKYQAYGQITGINPADLKYFDFEIEDGRALNEGDDYGFIYKNLTFNNPNSRNFEELNLDLLNERISFRIGYKDNSLIGQDSMKTYMDYKARAVGRIKSTTDFGPPEVYVNINTARKMQEEAEKFNKQQNPDSPNKKNSSKKRKNYDSLVVKVKDVKYVEEVQNQLKDLGYRTNSLLDISKNVQKQTQTIQAILGGIGGVSLLVAAIGIANTMIMSIYERNKEIGVMKVIGASIRDIRNIFLVEAGLIGLLGGILGIVLSAISSNILNNLGSGMSEQISYIPNWLLLAGAMFSSFIGILSGYLPAVKATKISAIVAIRNNG